MTATPRYSSTFIFEVGTLDDEFHRLDSEIARRAREIPGFLGEETWHNEETGLHAEVYYWRDMAALRQLVGMDTHASKLAIAIGATLHSGGRRIAPSAPNRNARAAAWKP